MAMPADRNWIGRAWIRLFIVSGDILRDMGAIFHRHGFAYSDEAVGLSGSLHLYVAVRGQSLVASQELKVKESKEQNGGVEAV
jgi:hypothetical protein